MNDTCKKINQPPTKWKDVILVAAFAIFMIAGWLFYGVSQVTIQSLLRQQERNTERIIELERDDRMADKFDTYYWDGYDLGCEAHKSKTCDHFSSGMENLPSDSEILQGERR